jgi:hypothetical protein
MEGSEGGRERERETEQTHTHTQTNMLIQPRNIMAIEN